MLSCANKISLDSRTLTTSSYQSPTCSTVAYCAVTLEYFRGTSDWNNAIAGEQGVTGVGIQQLHRADRGTRSLHCASESISRIRLPSSYPQLYSVQATFFYILFRGTQKSHLSPWPYRTRVLCSARVPFQCSDPHHLELLDYLPTSFSPSSPPACRNRIFSVSPSSVLNSIEQKRQPKLYSCATILPRKLTKTSRTSSLLAPRESPTHEANIRLSDSPTSRLCNINIYVLNNRQWRSYE